jgi:putative flippase GtrA
MRQSPVFCGGTAHTALVTFLNREKILAFFLIGIISSLLDIGLLYYFTGYLGVWYLLSAFVSYCCGTVVSYCLNKYLTFHNTSRHYLVQFTTFAVIAASGLMVTIGIIWMTVELLALNYLTAKIIAVVCAFFWNYYGQSRITFRHTTEDVL